VASSSLAQARDDVTDTHGKRGNCDRGRYCHRRLSLALER
jgi:hypothetical protein